MWVSFGSEVDEVILYLLFDLLFMKDKYTALLNFTLSLSTVSDVQYAPKVFNLLILESFNKKLKYGKRKSTVVDKEIYIIFINLIPYTLRKNKPNCLFFKFFHFTT